MRNIYVCCAVSKEVGYVVENIGAVAFNEGVANGLVDFDTAVEPCNICKTIRRCNFLPTLRRDLSDVRAGVITRI